MGGLLQNARRFLQGLATASPARAQRFSVPCPEGHRLTGVRTEGYQSLRCPTCGGGIFVLPRSVLPEPTPPASAVRESVNPVSAKVSAEIENAYEDDAPVALNDPEPHDDAAEIGEIEWVDEATPETPVFPNEANRPAPAPAPPRKKKVARKPKDEVAEPLPVEVAESVPVRLALADWLKRKRNPLVALGVVLAIAGAVAVRSWRSHRQDLPRIAELGRVEGLPALDEGKFDRAFQLLSAAKAAVIELGDAYQGAEAIKQGADEAAIINRLNLERPETLLGEASSTDPKDWARRFDSLYKGRTILVDASIKAIPDSMGAGGYALDYPIVPDGGDGGPPRSLGRIDLTGFRLFDLIKPRVGDRVTFGAKLDSFRFDPKSEVWLLGLEKDSGVIMTHVKALEALGWPSASDTTTEGPP